MKDIENIIITEEESLNENSGNCHTEFEGGERKHGCVVCVCVCVRACVRVCVSVEFFPGVCENLCE